MKENDKQEKQIRPHFTGNVTKMTPLRDRDETELLEKLDDIEAKISQLYFAARPAPSAIDPDTERTLKNMEEVLVGLYNKEKKGNGDDSGFKSISRNPVPYIVIAACMLAVTFWGWMGFQGTIIDLTQKEINSVATTDRIKSVVEDEVAQRIQYVLDAQNDNKANIKTVDDKVDQLLLDFNDFDNKLERIADKQGKR